jgi:hypothetical protein
MSDSLLLPALTICQLYKMRWQEILVSWSVAAGCGVILQWLKAAGKRSSGLGKRASYAFKGYSRSFPESAVS